MQKLWSALAPYYYLKTRVANNFFPSLDYSLILLAKKERML
jgi:hypothetical protein